MNAFNAVLNTPWAMLSGVERFAAAMENSGSWNESHPNNVWGWDPANPEHAKGLTDIFVPLPAVSTPLGEHINWWMAANLPMHEGCAFQCPELAGMLNSMFRVPIWEFWDEDGYTFPEVINPVDGIPTEWSGVTVKLDPWEPVKAFASYLMNDPGEVRFPTAYEVITGFANLASALQTTGHLPTWIAVREIETFLKLFVPKPDVETVDTDEGPDSLTGTQLENLRLVTVDIPAEIGAAPEADTTGDFGTLVAEGTAGDQDAEAVQRAEVEGPAVADLAALTVDPTDAGVLPTVEVPAVTETVPTADSDPVEADEVVEDGAPAASETRPTGGKHRKPTKLSEFMKSAADRFSNVTTDKVDAKNDVAGGDQSSEGSDDDRSADKTDGSDKGGNTEAA
ncbi:hypothetical protein C6A88_27870 [Mycolicibacterium austroafricanum]|nr:hypothetical protein C6A88_27870 [Mycolicibacterium austroafricanum]